MARWRRKSPESQEPRLINGENLASDQRSELARLALHCQQVTTEISRELGPDQDRIDYDNLRNWTGDLAATIKKIHEKDPSSVDYESWMLLLRLPGVLSEHPGFRSRVTRHRTWHAARKTATGREMVENDPELKKILKARKPTPYNEIIRRAFNSDPRYAGQTLDDSYSNSGSSSSSSDNTEISLPPTAFHHEPIDQQAA